MSYLVNLLYASLFLGGLESCSGQSTAGAATNQQIGGGCDGCELLFVGMPETIYSVDTSEAWHEKGQKLIVTGTVYQRDGKTPAADVVVYYWQTDQTGRYTAGSSMHPAAKQHGRLRGWIKTDANGRYAIYTTRPAPYPNEQLPAHIHLFILQPTYKNPYYVDDLVFDDDPLLIPYFKKNPPENRGGSGVLRILRDADRQIAEHDIILGLHIPDYPEKNAAAEGVSSGLEVGEDQPSFIPYHAFGPDKGTRTCPVCKYGRYQGLIYFVGKQPNWDAVRRWLTYFEEQALLRKEYLKVYFVYADGNGYSKQARQQQLEKLGSSLGLRQVALTYAPSVDDRETEMNRNKINPSVESTLVLYRHRKIVGKWINLSPGAESFTLINTTLERTRGRYWNLPALEHD